MSSFNNIWSNVFKINRFFSTSRHFRNHYETLNVTKNCSSKEIRDSFIKLSKKHHPDLNKHGNAHKKFLEINEAYKILSNTESRRNYDLGLTYSGTNNRTNVPETDPWNDPVFYHNRDKYENAKQEYYKHSSYYGIKGIERASNSTVVTTCLFLATFIVWLQFLAIKKSFTFHRDDLIAKSRNAENSLKSVRDTAASNGNKVQLELLKMRFEDRNRSK